MSRVRIPRRMLGVGVLAVACLAASAPAGGAVRSEGNSAFLNARAYVNDTTDENPSFSDSDFLVFGKTLAPNVQGPEGRSKSTAQLVATVVTGDNAFPLEPVAGTSVSARLTNVASKAQNALPTVPIGYSSADYTFEFDVTTPTPFQFAGAMTAKNTDPDQCTEIAVTLSGPLSRTFLLDVGLDCAPVKGGQKGFVVTKTLPVGTYDLEVELDTSIGASDPGVTENARAALQLSLAFNPPNTKLTSAKIKRADRRAKFGFKAKGKAKGFQCALTRGKAKPKFKKCKAPKVYTGLRRGTYLFQVRAVGKVAPDATPAKKRFTIP